MPDAPGQIPAAPQTPASRTRTSRKFTLDTERGQEPISTRDPVDGALARVAKASSTYASRCSMSPLAPILAVERGFTLTVTLGIVLLLRPNPRRSATVGSQSLSDF